jgi:vacuolar-type H+-ATPase subunit I/STV1
VKEKIKEVKLLKPFDVEKITIKRDSYFPNAYIADLPLDSMPDHVWQDIFERTWKSSRHLWDRKLYVVSDKLRLVTSVDDFEEKLNWIEQVIKETNKTIDEYNQTVQEEKDARIKEEMEKQTQLEETARVEMIRDNLRKKFL